MKKTIILLGLLTLSTLVYFFGLLVGGLAFIVICVLGISVEWRREHIEVLKQYAGRFENIYVVSNNPVTNGIVSFPHLDSFIVNANYSEVLAQCNIEKELLSESGNKFFAKVGVDKQHWLRVIPIIYQDAKAINESWEQFQERVKFEIETDRAKRHASLEKSDPNWYMKHGNNQSNVFEWEVENKKR